MKRLAMLAAACCTLAALSLPAYAADYTFAAPDVGLFGRPTSDDTVYVSTAEPANIDRSKNTALIPPAFGSATSYLPGSGEALTPNLTPGANTGAVIGGTVVPPPAVSGGVQAGIVSTGYTAVTSDLYYSGGYLGTLQIPAIGLTVRTYQGTDNASLARGAGHFAGTSIWNGNVAFAAHNRGVNNHFGKIHTLSADDKITLTTKLGTRSYAVYSVAKISVDDFSVFSDSGENIVTLITCVMNQPAYRWCVQARQI